MPFTAWGWMQMLARQPAAGGGIIVDGVTRLAKMWRARSGAGSADACIHYPAIVFLAATHVLAIASLPYMTVHGVGLWEAVFYLACYPLGGFGITALYHRAWTHNA